jgi:hypothetical protein
MRQNYASTNVKFASLLSLLVSVFSPCLWCSGSSTAFVGVTRTPVVLDRRHHSSTTTLGLNHVQRRKQNNRSSSSSSAVTTSSWRHPQHRPNTILSRLASKENNNDNSEEDEETIHNNNSDDADSTLPIDLFSGDISEKKVPSLTSQVTLGLFKFFSYCIQFLGLFFFCGLLLNFAGYGYTFDFEHGLVVDKIQNIRNEVQFEMEIEREEMEDLQRGGIMNTVGGSNTLNITPEMNVF